MMAFCAALLFALCLGFYTICSLQWYSYRASRALFHCAKPLWHVYFALLPFFIFIFALSFEAWAGLICAFCYACLLVFWQVKMATKLVITARIKRYFALLLGFGILVLFFLEKWYLLAAGILVCLVLSVLCSALIERVLAKRFLRLAKQKMRARDDLKVVLITASYGKTSIKNYLKTLLESSANVRATPRSVNTLMGLAQDINENLSDEIKIYIAEAGARQKGDIKDIAELIEPDFVIIGQIGTAHLEYFKSMESVRNTKLEALGSKGLKKAVLHSSTLLENNDKIAIYDKCVKNVNSTLNGLSFELLFGGGFKKIEITDLLGEFNAYNVAAAVLMAHELGASDEEIFKSLNKIKNAEHRLSKIESGGKIIIDDGFNGNFDGMSASYELVAAHNGRKVLVTPGIIEGEGGANARLSAIINDIFDVVIITSALNANELKSALKRPQIIELKAKKDLVSVLGANTKSGDLILFSNDAPEFI